MTGVQENRSMKAIIINFHFAVFNFDRDFLYKNFQLKDIIHNWYDLLFHIWASAKQLASIQMW